MPGTKAGVAGNADELDITDGAIKALYQSWPIQHRYAADGSVRANDGTGHPGRGEQRQD
ncbi:MAG: hypothetical protein ACLTDR_06135 [Adlercreutzia equolifaciens]